jgi:hypothetical protein
MFGSSSSHFDPSATEGISDSPEGGSLPVATQLSFLVHPRHVVARIADGAQDAAVFGRERPPQKEKPRWGGA